MDSIVIAAIKHRVVVLGDTAEVLFLQFEHPKVAWRVERQLLACLLDVADPGLEASLPVAVHRS